MMCLRDRQLVPAEVERRALPAVRGFDLDQPLAAVGLEAPDIIARSVAVEIPHPSYLMREVGAAGAAQRGALMRQHPLLAGSAERTVAGIALGDVELPGN